MKPVHEPVPLTLNRPHVSDKAYKASRSAGRGRSIRHRAISINAEGGAEAQKLAAAKMQTIINKTKSNLSKARTYTLDLFS